MNSGVNIVTFRAKKFRVALFGQLKYNASFMPPSKYADYCNVRVSYNSTLKFDWTHIDIIKVYVYFVHKGRQCDT